MHDSFHTENKLICFCFSISLIKLSATHAGSAGASQGRAWPAEKPLANNSIFLHQIRNNLESIAAGGPREGPEAHSRGAVDCGRPWATCQASGAAVPGQVGMAGFPCWSPASVSLYGAPRSEAFLNRT